MAHSYGWVRDLPDHRDYLYSVPHTLLRRKLPESVDLRPQCPGIYDQGQLGACVANGVGAAIEFDQLKQKSNIFVPSRLFIYWNARDIEGSTDSDSGAQIRDGVKSVAQLGAPPETDWSYDISKFKEKPPTQAYADAKADLVSSYQRVSQTLPQMQGCLAEGYPFVIGIAVYESFESAQVAKTGNVPMPSSREKCMGGHCMLAVGYDNADRTFWARNSWSQDWGAQGYCKLPMEYLTNPNLASDFWTIRSVTG